MYGQTDGWGVTVSPNEPMEGDSRVHITLLLPRHRLQLVPFFVFALQHHLDTQKILELEHCLKVPYYTVFINISQVSDIYRACL